MVAADAPEEASSDDLCSATVELIIGQPDQPA
jgi:hypothetical protein